MWPEGVRLIVDSTTISNLFSNIQSAPKSTIYNIQVKFCYNLQFLLKSQKCSLQIYKILARIKCCLQGFLIQIYSLRIDCPPPPAWKT